MGRTSNSFAKTRAPRPAFCVVKASQPLSQPVSDLLQVFVENESVLGHRAGGATATVSLLSLLSFKFPLRFGQRGLQLLPSKAKSSARSDPKAS